MKKRITYLMILVICLLSVTLVASASLDLETSKKGVVRIIATDGYDWWQGTGFAIGPEGEPVIYIVTNYHVVGGMNEVFLYRGEDDLIPLYPTSIALPVNDVAVMELDEPLHDLVPMILETVNLGKSGDRIYALGFPALADSIDGSMSGKPEDVTVTSGIISKVTDAGDDVEFYQIDAVINGGNSGGPLLNEAGHVIAINSFGLMGESDTSIGYNGSVILDELIDALDSRGYEFIKSEDLAVATLSTDVKDSEVLSDAETQVEESKTDDETSRESKSTGVSNIILLLAIGGGLFIIVIVIIIVIVSSGKKQKVAPRAVQQVQAAPIANPAPIPALNPTLVGITGHQAGKSFNIDTTLTIGRNPSNRIVYPADYKGISGNHCMVQFDPSAKMFVITDNGSSFGTFLANGQRIASGAKVALNRGDRFYLANTQDLFEVRY